MTATEVETEVESPTTRPLVIYHSPCLDGFTAAWSCWLKNPDWEYYPGVHGEAPPDVSGRQVFLLDFSYKFPVMEKLLKAADWVVVLDHHKTAEADLTPLLESGRLGGKFDMKHSGAYLAWEYFHPEEPVPYFVKLVEDRDLWKFDLPHSRELNSLFFSYDYDF